MFDDVAQRDRLAVGQRVLLHQDVPADPVLRESCRFQKSARPLDPSEIRRNRVRDSEARLETHWGTAFQTSIMPVNAADFR